MQNHTMLVRQKQRTIEMKNSANVIKHWGIYTGNTKRIILKPDAQQSRRIIWKFLIVCNKHVLFT